MLRIITLAALLIYYESAPDANFPKEMMLRRIRINKSIVRFQKNLECVRSFCISSFLCLLTKQILIFLILILHKKNCFRGRFVINWQCRKCYYPQHQFPQENLHPGPIRNKLAMPQVLLSSVTLFTYYQQWQYSKVVIFLKLKFFRRILVVVRA